jgi:hypothetical protein
VNSDQNTAIAQQQGQRFQSLDSDVQNLILQVAAGHTRIEQIVSSEAKATREAINSHTTEFKALAVKNISDNQRQRLLKSLKTEEIRERYNSVLPSSDACFERVFASYERVCRKDPGYKAWNKNERDFGEGSNEESDEDSEEARFKEEVDEIDLIWELFSSWLQSDDKLFWIRGKPGSGKSILIKFVINNDSTTRLLGSWYPNTRLLSHFFWKIGSEPQNSIKGLLCSLLHDLLSEDDDAIDKVLREFKFSQSKDFYKEWSSQEAEEILLSLLDPGAHSTCIFIDGLDEISNKDGYQALLSVVQRLTSCQRVKVCVSSRPETELVKRLESIGAQNLRLDDLTKPEMAVYLRKEFHTLPRDQSADLPLEEFAASLLEKAQGVFLWLALATKSVTNGIMNGDDQETLSQRLQELPEELESLYQTMWERLNGNNRVYRETAAKYFRFIVADGWDTHLQKKGGYIYPIGETNLAQLSLAIKVEERLVFPPKANKKTLFELNDLCAATERDIQTRCAGMLQVGRQADFPEQELPDAIYPLIRPVQFVHRTAHDFLVDTEAGQSIVNYKSNETTSIDTEIKLLQCRINLANTYYHELGVVTYCVEAMADCNRLKNKGANPKTMLEILKIMEDLYENGALGGRGAPSQPNRSFPCVAAYHLTSFEDFVISCFMRTPSQELATNSLHELTLETRFSKWTPTPIRIIRRMIEVGGEAHVAKRSDLSFELPGYKMPTTQYTTAFESFLSGALDLCLLLEGDGMLKSAHASIPTLILDVIEILVQTCPDLHRRVILFLDDLGGVLSDQLPSNYSYMWAALEVDLQFLISRLTAVADSWNIPTESYMIHDLASSFTKPYARVRHIILEEEDQLYCYRVLDQKPFLDTIGRVRAGEALYHVIPEVLGAINGLMNGSIPSESNFSLETFEKVDLGEEIDMLVQEGVGLHRDDGLDVD